jgi:hypothetical protein
LEISEEELYRGVSVDYLFNGERPLFGDLFEICGYINPNFPPTGKFNFSRLEELQFSQVDDYFAVQALSDEGDDVVIWLYPLIRNEAVDHHPGPFDGIRIEFNVLRNPGHRKGHFIKVCKNLERELNVSSDLSIEDIEAKIEAITAYWKAKNIESGSVEALEIDY